MKSGCVLIWKKPLKRVDVAYSFSTATQLIHDCWMSRDSIVYAGEAVVSWWPYKMNLQTSVRPLEAIVFDWDEKQTQARWDSRPRGYTASMGLCLLKWPKLRMTCLQRTMCADELETSFSSNLGVIAAPSALTSKIRTLFPHVAASEGCVCLRRCTLTCAKTCILHGLKGGFDKRERCCSSLKLCSKTYLLTACLHVS